jgi:hypothetical protein
VAATDVDADNIITPATIERIVESLSSNVEFFMAAEA